MTLKKTYDGKTKVSIGNDAVIELRKGSTNWQFRMWIAKEDKMYRKSLNTSSVDVAETKAIDLVVDAKSRINNGKTFYSLSCEQAVAKYLQHRTDDIGQTIVHGRFNTISIHLKHFLKYIGPHTRLKDLDIKSCKGYFNFRKHISKTTLGNEQSTINAMIKWLHEEKEIELTYFKFPKLKALDMIDTDKIKRQTFSNEEYANIVKVMRDYCKKTNYVSHEELLHRQIVRHYILIAANCGFRTGEQRQLKWKDIKIFKRGEKTFAEITVRKETSKVRKSRTFVGRKGEYFERLKKITKPKSKDDFVFFQTAEKSTSKKIIYKHFAEIIKLAKIEDVAERKIVPYSLRHFCITQRIKSGCTFSEVADMCGTSINQIEKTYWHADTATKLSTAIKDYRTHNNVIELKNA
tara:strand:- start:1212 stop:2429 length:1218 start_codon:yes stop_codon:yes gene_type:complete